MRIHEQGINRLHIETPDALFALDRCDIQKNLEMNRALHITGAALSLEDFFRFSADFISIFQADPSSYGNRPTLDADASAYEAVRGNEMVVPHGELYSLPSPPDYIFLYCGQPASEGGETTFYDGAEVARRLSVEVHEEFKNNAVVYTHTWDRPQWQHYFRTNDFAEALSHLEACAQVVIRERREDRLVFEFETFAINFCGAFVNGIANISSRGVQGINRVNFRDGRLIAPDLLEAIATATESCEVRVPWSKGDILLLDNHRMMHGRRAFSGERKVAVRFGKKRL